MQTARGASLNDAHPAAPTPTLRRRRLSVLFAVALFVYALDQVTKYLAVRYLSDRDPIPLIDGLLGLRLVRNSGAAFSIGTGMTAVFSVVAFLVVIVILRSARRLASLGWAISLGLVLGGATGNLTDRLLRSPGFLQGHVVDFLEFPNFPVFNVADSAIVCGGALLVVLTLRGIAIDGPVARD
jgi:signal peptidase II